MFTMEDFLVENLFVGEREARIQAATELSKLSSKQRQKVAEKGVIVPLVSMLHSQDHEAIEAALFALLSLAFGSERNKILIVKSGVIPVLLELLQCQSRTLIELSVAAMLILSSCAANKLVIASSGAIQLLVGILNGVYDNDNYDSICTQTTLDVIATLHNLSTCHQIIPAIVSFGAVFILLQLIHRSEKSSELAEKAMSLLENIASVSEYALEEIAGTGGAIRALVEIIEEGSPQCKEHAVGILFLICQSCRERYRGLILREGVMPGVLQLSVDGTWRAKKRAQDLLLLLRDCSNSRGKPSKHERMEQIMQAIDSREEVEGTTLRLVEEMIAKLSI
ncbi:KAP domain-containing protein [Cephalotus follicularis]|uniref:KAP domain-containing protein n=1 Tax=Cephalotus follicularis TaxID=3775 RepID=A0A1Q3BKM8_CEPFO|nr:KAP domain-containing protein [Cephalotus follicularis]